MRKNVLKKQTGDKDCRALKEEFFQWFCEGGRFYPFVQLVEKHKEELCMCFRGNEALEKAVIYYNNHQVFILCSDGKVGISFDHARYTEEWQRLLNRLLVEYDFGRGKRNLEPNSKNSIGEIFRKEDLSPLTMKDVEIIYTEIIAKMMKDYFCYDNTRETDYFKVHKCAKQITKRRQTEKIVQQRLFLEVKETKSGHFIYDLEFAQKHTDKTEQKKDKANNEPDMLAIRFDTVGKPKGFVMVEVKTDKKSCKGASGLEQHIRKMKEYQEEHIADRRREAALIMDHYRRLGWYGLEEKTSFSLEEFAAIPMEILIILTGTAKGMMTDILKDAYQAKLISLANSVDAEIYSVLIG